MSEQQQPEKPKTEGQSAQPAAPPKPKMVMVEHVPTKLRHVDYHLIRLSAQHGDPDAYRIVPKKERAVIDTQFKMPKQEFDALPRPNDMSDAIEQLLPDPKLVTIAIWMAGFVTPDTVGVSTQTLFRSIASQFSIRANALMQEASTPHQ